MKSYKPQARRQWWATVCSLPRPPSLYLRKLGAWLWSDHSLVYLVASSLVATEPLSYLTDNHKQLHLWKLRGVFRLPSQRFSQSCWESGCCFHFPSSSNPSAQDFGEHSVWESGYLAGGIYASIFLTLEPSVPMLLEFWGLWCEALSACFHVHSATPSFLMALLISAWPLCAGQEQRVVNLQLEHLVCWSYISLFSVNILTETSFVCVCAGRFL